MSKENVYIKQKRINKTIMEMCYWLKKLGHLEKTTGLSEVADKLYHI